MATLLVAMLQLAMILTATAFDEDPVDCGAELSAAIRQQVDKGDRPVRLTAPLGDGRVCGCELRCAVPGASAAP